ncbi:MAG TPA: gamma-glutamyltransferase family protein [Vicinamibacterales bacterium]|nr:gamma-glutamyltransferase family protein [Vicinamibacterales bacterium]
MSVVCGRSRIATQYGIVAASQPLAARAGVQILERGGTAVDAAIAANAVMGVVEPEMNGIGGDLFAIVYDAASGTLHGLNAGGWTPAALTPERLRSEGHAEMPFHGVHSVTVPGCVAGWTALHRRFGALPLQHVLAPAIFYAERGFPVSDIIAERWAAWTDKLRADPHAAATFLVDGRAPNAGELFVNAPLGRSLRIVAKDGARGFYEGPVAQAILEAIAARGGVMAADDLREYAPEWVAPISRTYRGWEVFELPPNTQGVAALMMLGIMEQFPLRDYGFQSARALHVMIEAKKLAYADMLRYVGDPRFGAAPIEAMLSVEHAKARARSIREDEAAAHVEPSVFAGLTTMRGGDTIYLSTIDRHGNIVSLIQSIYDGFGSGVAPTGGGFMLHNRAALFTLEAHHPNVLAPRKRPLHTIIPGFMRRDGVTIGFGIMGAWNQAQAHAQFVANIVDFDLDIQQALEAGRFTKPTFTGADVFVEALVPEAARTVLAKLGHEVTVVPPRTGTFGSGQAVMNDGKGVHYGASEPRHDGAAIPEAPPVFGQP